MAAIVATDKKQYKKNLINDIEKNHQNSTFGMPKASDDAVEACPEDDISGFGSVDTASEALWRSSRELSCLC